MSSQSQHDAPCLAELVGSGGGFLTLNIKRKVCSAYQSESLFIQHGWGIWCADKI